MVSMLDPLLIPSSLDYLCFLLRRAAAQAGIAKLSPAVFTPAQKSVLLKGSQIPEPRKLCCWIVFESHHCWQELRQAPALVLSRVTHHSITILLFQHSNTYL